MTDDAGPGRRSRRVTVRLTDDEWEEVDALCTRHGLRPSAVLRAGVDALRNRVPAATVAAPPAATDVMLVKAVNRIGGNINQVVRRAHQQGVDDAVLDGILDEMRTVRMVVTGEVRP